MTKNATLDALQLRITYPASYLQVRKAGASASKVRHRPLLTSTALICWILLSDSTAGSHKLKLAACPHFPNQQGYFKAAADVPVITNTTVTWAPPARRGQKTRSYGVDFTVTAPPASSDFLQIHVDTCQLNNGAEVCCKERAPVVVK